MNNILNKLNLFFEAVPDTVRRYRILVWIIFFALNLVILKGIPFFKVDLTMDAYLQQDDPVKIAFDNFRADFGSDTVIFSFSNCASKLSQTIKVKPKIISSS